jgi:hypothetical protein
MAEWLDDPRLIEALAAIEHDRWSGWERYRERCVAQVRRDGDTETHEDRWRRQRETPYEKLSEREKESDRAEVRKTLSAIKEFLSSPPPDGNVRCFRCGFVTSASALRAGEHDCEGAFKGPSNV